MTQISLIPPTAGGARPLGPHNTRLHGSWLLVARVGTISLSLALLALFFVMLPAMIGFLETPCAGGNCPLTPEQVQHLGALGLTAGSYATFYMALLLISSIPSLMVAVLLFWRRSDDWMALLAALQVGNLSGNIVGAAGIWQTPAFVLHVSSLVLFYLYFSIFPSGRFVPRWSVVIVLGYLVFQVAPYFVSSDRVLTGLGGPLNAFFYGNLLFSQIYRYWRFSGPVERQQTKWVVFGLIVVLLALNAYWVFYTFIPSLRQPDSLYAPLVYPIFLFISASSPLFIGVAILRYRLWDIDTLINKALVYGSLTGLLGALYAGLIIGLEHLVGLFGGMAAQNPVVLVISTLAIAALFQPVRRRIQHLIDRRFYRRKYDAEKTLAGFSATLRNEVDLEQVRGQVLAVVNETMQPAHVSLWLRAPERQAMQEAWRSGAPAGTTSQRPPNATSVEDRQSSAEGDQR